MAKKEFEHLVLNTEINSISGHMVIQKEEKMIYNGKQLLFYTGYGVTDSSCCGNGAAIFTYVPGYIVNWHSKTSDNGTNISEIDTIEDDSARKEITKIIIDNNINFTNVMQVNFL